MTTSLCMNRQGSDAISMIPMDSSTSLCANRQGSDICDMIPTGSKVYDNNSCDINCKKILDDVSMNNMGNMDNLNQDIYDSIKYVYSIDKDMLLSNYKNIIDQYYLQLINYYLEELNNDLTNFIYDNLESPINLSDDLENLVYDYYNNKLLIEYLINKGIRLPDDFIKRLFDRNYNQDTRILKYLKSINYDLSDEIDNSLSTNCMNYRYLQDINKVINYRDIYGLSIRKLMILGSIRYVLLTLIGIALLICWESTTIYILSTNLLDSDRSFITFSKCLLYFIITFGTPLIIFSLVCYIFYKKCNARPIIYHV